ncbi:MAG: LacI family DNA-binding transcriptional regulator [Lachnospiraceae bacterium]|nr:LacI family DNA-binding transcriptional regulator [Lachnospiraceae bacterium]MBO4558680.1 LacI family DNA-binding transcriptional regulator [Lachnospiraceae bacterium]MBR5732957.1 LacI family DNA-binding transcriptional regulator [Lachnospiraceae bacterium]
MAKNNDNDKAITIYDIAREAGVSPSTVSRVLTNSVNVRPEKRERVQALIEKYNFRPNALAKGLSDTRSRVIGVLMADIRNPFYAALYVSCENAALARGYRVILCCSLGETEREIEQLDILKQQSVEAIIQIGGMVDAVITDPAYIRKAKQISEQLPIITSGKIDEVSCHRVVIDSNEAVKLLAEHLISLGHERIALVGGRLDVISTYEKYMTFCKILKAHGIPVNKRYVYEGTYDYDAGYEGVKELMAMREKPTAIIAINDFCAAGVIRRLVEEGYRVPGDVSVVSYDNTYITNLIFPKITSIDYDYDTLGRMLADTAIDVANGESVPSFRSVTPRLEVRESSGRLCASARIGE